MRIGFMEIDKTNGVTINPNFIMKVRKVLPDEIKTFKEKGIKIPKCIVTMIDGKEIFSYDKDYSDIHSVTFIGI